MAKHRQENRLASSATQTTQKRRRSPSVLLLSITAAVVDISTAYDTETPPSEIAGRLRTGGVVVIIT